MLGSLYVQEVVSWAHFDKEFRMRTGTVRLKGKKPLLMDAMSSATMDGLETGVRPPEVKDRPATEKCAPKIYRHPDTGRIGLPVELFFACLKQAGRKVKNGRYNISTATGTTLYGMLDLKEDFLPLLNIPEKVKPESKEEGKYWKVDRRRGIGKQAKTPTAVAVIRPAFAEWEFEVTVEYDEKKINGETVKRLFQEAGSGQGLCGFRPNCGGPFGRFELVHWPAELDSNPADVVPEEDEAEATDPSLVEDNGELVGAGSKSERF